MDQNYLWFNSHSPPASYRDLCWLLLQNVSSTQVLLIGIHSPMALGQDTSISSQNCRASSQVSWLSPLAPALKFQQGSQNDPLQRWDRVLLLLSPGHGHSFCSRWKLKFPNLYTTWPHSYFVPHHLFSPLLTLSSCTERLAVSPRGQAYFHHGALTLAFLLPGTFLIAFLSLPSSVCLNISVSMKPALAVLFNILSLAL